MDGLCNTAQILCTHCQVNPRLPKQRWCRTCLTQSQRERRAAQRATQTDDITTPVTQAAIQAMPRVPQEDAQASVTATHQPAEVSPPRSHEIAQALAAYTNAELAYRLATRRAWPLLPLARTIKVHHLWRQVELTRRQLALVQGTSHARRSDNG